jgi:hypothetical protein
MITTGTTSIAPEARQSYKPAGRKRDVKSKPAMKSPSGPKGPSGKANTGMNGGMSASPNITVPTGRTGQPGGMTEINLPAQGKMTTHKHVKKAAGTNGC